MTEKVLKLFVYDRGWAGASVYIGYTIEEAKKELLDGAIAYYKEAAKTHDAVDKKTGRTRHNPSAEIYEKMTTDPVTDYIQTFDIEYGAIIETDGEG
jgi:hypothetical protein